VIRIYKRYCRTDVKFYPVPDFNKNNPNSGKGGFSPVEQLLSLLPEGIDMGDVILILLLLLLYLDSRDEEFLIMLIVMAMSFFQK